MSPLGKMTIEHNHHFFEQNMAAVKTAGADYLESLPNTIIKCLCIYLYVCMHLNMYMCVIICTLYIYILAIVMIIKVMILIIIIIIIIYIYVPSVNIVIKTIIEKPEKT